MSVYQSVPPPPPPPPVTLKCHGQSRDVFFVMLTNLHTFYGMLKFMHLNY